jgi:hypothetical protein
MQEREDCNPKFAEIAQRAVLLQLLRDDHDERWSRAELDAEVSDIEPGALSDGLEQLERDGLVLSLDDEVLASRSARHVDDLRLVGI